MKTLAQIPMHKKMTVLGIAEGELKPKLLEMGLYPGKQVEVLFKAPFGDPIAVDISGYTLSMRLSEANLIEVE
ncbi:FeoA family protein [Fluviicola chungangensis]|uniref:Ferrous iron transport protein A n=1 Tax=Fluviicola chungangensis TaxID=2597671 RepID=A0A556N2F2_9FLAO|nr:FeoA family protein [Fluviicola chungangensis]TSJ46370.1 ferrous iron transport protein A [Fluviicola chungangensis]